MCWHHNDSDHHRAWDEMQVEHKLLREKCLGHITAMTTIVLCHGVDPKDCGTSWLLLMALESIHREKEEIGFCDHPTQKHKWKIRKSKWQGLKSPLSYAVTKI